MQQQEFRVSLYKDQSFASEIDRAARFLSLIKYAERGLPYGFATIKYKMINNGTVAIRPIVIQARASRQ